MPPLLWLLHGLRQQSIRPTLTVMAIGLGVGALFFLGVLGTAIGYDIKRNWGRPERALEWNPLLFWRVFLQGGSLMFVALALLFYRQAWYLSLGFAAFAILCWLIGGVIAAPLRLPESVQPEIREDTGRSEVHMSKHKHWGGGHLHPGFVAMEYFGLVLNRSFLIFITEGGLRGWKFHGVVSSMEPLFYLPAEVLLDDPEMTPGSQAFENFMRQHHGFVWPYSEIRSVEFLDRQKWGMGPIPHDGRLRLRFSRHASRELILLGSPQGQLIRSMIASRIQPR